VSETSLQHAVSPTRWNTRVCF